MTDWKTIEAAAWRMKMRAVKIADRLGADATPEQIADEVMAETTDAEEVRLACHSYARFIGHLELGERSMPRDHGLADDEAATVELARRAMLRKQAGSVGAS